MNTSRVMSSLSGRSHMILYAVRDTMYIYLSMITLKASRLPRATSLIKNASLACPILICPFIKFIQGALFKNNSEDAPSDSKKQNAPFLSARAEVLRSGSVQRFCAEGSMPRFHAATHPFSQDSLYREQEAAFLLRFRAATHPFKKKNLYRDSRIQEKQWHNAATHHFPRNSVCRERETANRSQHTKTTAAPQKKSARIGSD